MDEPRVETSFGRSYEVDLPEKKKILGHMSRETGRKRAIGIATGVSNHIESR